MNVNVIEQEKVNEQENSIISCYHLSLSVAKKSSYL